MKPSTRSQPYAATSATCCSLALSLPSLLHRLSAQIGLIHQHRRRASASEPSLSTRPRTPRAEVVEEGASINHLKPRTGQAIGSSKLTVRSYVSATSEMPAAYLIASSPTSVLSEVAARSTVPSTMTGSPLD